MILDEIFDSQYTLIRIDNDLSEVIKSTLIGDGYTRVSVYSTTEDPHQIFMTGVRDGAWEVHNTVAVPGKNFISGEIITGSGRANPKFIATAMNIYKRKLEELNRVRVISVPVLWKTYQKVINRMVNRDKYEVGELIRVTRDGTEMVSQEIRPKSKFESLGKTAVPL